jgi:hypothetical protein
MKVKTGVIGIIWVLSTILGGVLKIMHKGGFLTDILLVISVITFWYFIIKLIGSLRSLNTK